MSDELLTPEQAAYFDLKDLPDSGDLPFEFNGQQTTMNQTHDWLQSVFVDSPTQTLLVEGDQLTYEEAYMRAWHRQNDVYFDLYTPAENKRKEEFLVLLMQLNNVHNPDYARRILDEVLLKDLINDCSQVHALLFKYEVDKIRSMRDI